MIWHSYNLGETILKTTESLKLLETEKAIVEISGNTLAIPVMLNNSLEGYVYHGDGKLVLDTIVETEQGAVGRPVEEEINRPFLMLGNAEGARQQLRPASQKDLSERGYTEQGEFILSAEGLLNSFSRRGRTHNCRHHGDGSVFAFQNETNKLDFLIVNGEKFVYKTTDSIFVSNRDRVIFKNSIGVVCINNGKSIIVKK